MKKITWLLFALCLTECLLAQEVTGLWYGRAQLGPQTLRINFDLQQQDGMWSGAMQSPDQSAQWIPMSGVAVRDDTLRVQISPLGFSYIGVFDTEKLQGAFTQRDSTFPLGFTRSEIVANRPQEPKPPYPYTVEEVTFRNDAAGVTLTGTLTAPFGGGPSPAVVLVTGSGAQDRDEKVAGHRPFWIVADYLTRHGIAVLRYDDRGTAESGGDYPAATIWDLAEDTDAALRYLRARPETAAGKVGVIGHSEGGAIALRAAAEGVADFIVLLAGPGVPGKTLLDQQRSALFRASGVPDSLIDRYNRKMNEVVDTLLMLENREEMRAAVTALLAHTPIENETETALAQLSSPEMRSFLRFDPMDYFPAVTCPVLALNGDKDLQVLSGPNLDGFRNGLAHNARVTIQSYPDLNHLFQTAVTGLPAEYGEIEESFSPIVLNDIVDWILRNAPTRSGEK